MIKGSCLCGAIGFEVAELAGPIVHCHCHTCRKAHSATFGTSARVKREHFRWVCDEELLSVFASSPKKKRYFCSQCGSHLMAEWIDEPAVILRVAALDTDPGSVPEKHIWVSHDVSWLSYGTDLPQHIEGLDSHTLEK
jgi:hypothetical protein